MMDEHLIGEVERHAVIYNRQKSNMFNGDKSANKELAWTKIALNLSSDSETCKKRWKYLRERYVQQKKTGDSPSYEHLSRPYLEKMRFLDNFIQPRKSYRNVSNMLQSPNHSQHSLMDGVAGMSCAKDESSYIDRRLEKTLQISQIMQQFHNHMLPDAMAAHNGAPSVAVNGGAMDHNSGHVSSESFFEQYSNNFQSNHNALNQAPHQTPQHHAPQQQHHPNNTTTSNSNSSYHQTSHLDPSLLMASNSSSTNSEAAVPNADAALLQACSVESVIKNELQMTIGSSSSSLTSSLASPVNGSAQHHHGDTQTPDNPKRSSKRRRSSVSFNTSCAVTSNQMQLASNRNPAISTHFNNHNNNHHQQHHLSDDEDNDPNSPPVANGGGRLRSPQFPVDFLYPFYQHATTHAQHQRHRHKQQQQAPIMRQPDAVAGVPPPPPVRNSEQLLGELVTAELLKMTDDRRRVAQKKILQLLFFDD